MNIRNAIRTLAAAAVLAVTVVSVSAPQADARPRRQPTVRDEMCALPGSAVGSSNDWEFYSAGDQITVRGSGYVCFGDGTWYRLY